MKSARALRLAMDVARRARDDAATQLAQALRQHQAAQVQQEQLRAYALESTQQWFNRAQRSVAMGLVQQHDQFMGKLDHAIIFQGDMIDRQASIVSARRAALVLADQKLQRYEHMLQLWQTQADQRAARQDQKTTDEQAMQAHRRQRLQAARRAEAEAAPTAHPRSPA